MENKRNRPVKIEEEFLRFIVQWNVSVAGKRDISQTKKINVKPLKKFVMHVDRKDILRTQNFASKAKDLKLRVTPHGVADMADMLRIKSQRGGRQRQITNGSHETTRNAEEYGVTNLFSVETNNFSVRNVLGNETLRCEVELAGKIFPFL